MAEMREAWITGIGLVSSLGEGLDAHWEALAAGTVNVNSETLAPYLFHPMAPLNLDQQIPKKGDQRQMEAWQRIGTYAAGLALDAAGIKGNADILSRTDMIVAAGGGERDIAVDSAIMTARAQGDTSSLNERLMNNLRPTLFLAQLSNLLAGNISIVHGVTGSSRTFMGEEAAGVDAVRIALARISAGQSDIALVGAANNAERGELVMLYEFDGFSLKGDFRPLWARDASHGGFALGSGGVFLVIESRDHAQARGAKPLARLSAVAAEHARRAGDNSSVTATLESLWTKIGAEGKANAIVTGATGAEPATSAERAFLKAHAKLPVRSTATQFGHMVEAQFPLALAVATLCIARGAMPPSHDPSGFEAASTDKPKAVAVVGVGHWRGEGMALVEAVS